MVERVPAHAEQLLGPIQRVGHDLLGEELDAFGATRSRAGAGPVRAHAADIGRHRGGRHSFAVCRIGMAVNQEGSGSSRCGLTAVHHLGGSRPLRGELRLLTKGVVGDVLHVAAGRVGDLRTHLDHQQPGRRGQFVEFPGVGAAAGAAADDHDVDVVCLRVFDCHCSHHFYWSTILWAATAPGSPRRSPIAGGTMWKHDQRMAPATVGTRSGTIENTHGQPSPIDVSPVRTGSR